MSTTAEFSDDEKKDFYGRADFFRLLDCDAPVNLTFLRGGAQIAQAKNVTQGYSERFSEAFDRVQITSSAAQSIHFVTRFGSVVGYDRPPVGDVAITNAAGPFLQGRVSVGTGSAVQLRPANTLRRRLLVQNNAAAGVLRLTVDGSAPSATDGLRLEPGDSLDLDGFCPTGAVRAIMESGAASFVEWLEG
ncbi:hypothetical protein P3G55_20710 [Leptospira sp. 96542]|nr:hypothetical protein [Leptospira sp. 96542]